MSKIFFEYVLLYALMLQVLPHLSMAVTKAGPKEWPHLTADKPANEEGTALLPYQYGKQRLEEKSMSAADHQSHHADHVIEVSASGTIQDISDSNLHKNSARSGVQSVEVSADGGVVDFSSAARNKDELSDSPQSAFSNAEKLRPHEGGHSQSKTIEQKSAHQHSSNFVAQQELHSRVGGGSRSSSSSTSSSSSSNSIVYGSSDIKSNLYRSNDRSSNRNVHAKSSSDTIQTSSGGRLMRRDSDIDLQRFGEGQNPQPQPLAVRFRNKLDGRDIADASKSHGNSGTATGSTGVVSSKDSGDSVVRAGTQDDDEQPSAEYGGPWKDRGNDHPGGGNRYKYVADSTPMTIAAGIGTMTYERLETGSQSREMSRQLRERLVLQDRATIAILLAILFATIFVSSLGVYQFSDDPSPVQFYSDPKHERNRILCSGGDSESFLQAFNTQTSTAWLRIIGRVADQSQSRRSTVGAVAADFLRGAAAGLLPGRRRGRPVRDDDVIFDVCLDVSSFISGEGSLASEEDQTTLEHYLKSSNPLEVLVLQKVAKWESWEDVATNIRQKLRRDGFEGDVEVRFDSKEELRIYRNHQWQNFARSGITQLLAFLSGPVGLFIWLPYLHMRTKFTKVHTSFRLNLDMARYWEMLDEGLHPQDGFRGPSWAVSSG
eukprot:TRINITY_DN27217_c0_g1_i1.p1 TRINITY_DN27217_c0_g1~~TRINITY_DN27217_c0_g1_i1.p1  ORF type:complete len:659 (+),score=116.40 TRINITY_DN27217_c0_g1_i1:225-2201(+)